MFQDSVNLNLPIAVEGNRATNNPVSTAYAPVGGFTAGIGGVTVGRFAWAAYDGITVYSYGTNGAAPTGFIERNTQALIQVYLQQAGNNIPQGFGVTLMNGGDFWAKVTGSTPATVGAPVYATFATGEITIGSAAPGSTAVGSIGSSDTASIGATFTATATGVDLVVTAVTGYISVGDSLNGTGIPVGTTVTSQISGTTGGAGTYKTSVPTTASAATITAYGEVLNVTFATGLVSVGDFVSGSGAIPAGTQISSQISGTPNGVGLYTLTQSATAYVASTTLTTYGIVLNVTAITEPLMIGDAISGINIPVGASVASQISGALGGPGVYTISVAASAYAASTTITVAAGILTPFVCSSAAAVGQLVVISRQAF